ncbi:DUF397 domain-containing protein [Streptomyces sp. NPDC003011]
MSDRSQTSAEPAWFKSSYSGGNATECVEAAFVSSCVLIRDSKRPAHSHMCVPADAWATFVAHTGRIYESGR